VREWHSPNFQGSEGLFTLIFLILALVLVFRGRRALAWRDIIPSLGFLVLGLLALRNLPMLGVAIAPVLARVMRPDTPAPEPTGSTFVNRIMALVLVAAYLLFGVNALTNGGVDAKSYPYQAVNFMQRHGLVRSAHRAVEQDIIGCYLILRFGENAHVFIDDRVDMYPLKVSHEYEDLLYGHDNALRILDRNKVDVILWDRTLPLVVIAKTSGQWHQVFTKNGWAVLVRTGTQLT